LVVLMLLFSSTHTRDCCCSSFCRFVVMSLSHVTHDCCCSYFICNKQQDYHAISIQFSLS
jgi:hypothetical protein